LVVECLFFVGLCVVDFERLADECFDEVGVSLAWFEYGDVNLFTRGADPVHRDWLWMMCVCV
jgi:hypothetical protein